MDRFTAHMDRAWDLISKGNGVKALLAARQALGIDANSPEVHNLLGCIYAMDGDFSEALDSYQRAMELDDDYLDPVLNSAEILLHSRSNTKEAIELCDKARSLVSANEDFIEVVLLEIDAYLNMGQSDKARICLKEVEEKSSLNAFHSMLIGRAFLEIGDFAKARKHINHSISQDPTLADAWHCLGLLQREEGLRIDAVESFLKVLEADQVKTTLPWIENLISTISTQHLKDVIIHKKEEIKETLENSEVILAPLPSKTHVLNEIDPRQPVLIEGINLEKRSFERLWIFYKNFEYTAITPDSWEETLAAQIEEEIFLARSLF